MCLTHWCKGRGVGYHCVSDPLVQKGGGWVTIMCLTHWCKGRRVDYHYVSDPLVQREEGGLPLCV